MYDGDIDFFTLRFIRSEQDATVRFLLKQADAWIVANEADDEEIQIDSLIACYGKSAAYRSLERLTEGGADTEEFSKGLLGSIGRALRPGGRGSRTRRRAAAMRPDGDPRFVRDGNNNGRLWDGTPFEIPDPTPGGRRGGVPREGLMRDGMPSGRPDPDSPPPSRYRGVAKPTRNMFRSDSDFRDALAQYEDERAAWRLAEERKKPRKPRTPDPEGPPPPSRIGKYVPREEPEPPPQFRPKPIPTRDMFRSDDDYQAALTQWGEESLQRTIDYNDWRATHYPDGTPRPRVAPSDERLRGSAPPSRVGRPAPDPGSPPPSRVGRPDPEGPPPPSRVPPPPRRTGEFTHEARKETAFNDAAERLGISREELDSWRERNGYDEYMDREYPDFRPIDMTNTIVDDYESSIGADFNPDAARRASGAPSRKRTGKGGSRDTAFDDAAERLDISREELDSWRKRNGYDEYMDREHADLSPSEMTNTIVDDYESSIGADFNPDAARRASGAPSRKRTRTEKTKPSEVKEPKESALDDAADRLGLTREELDSRIEDIRVETEGTYGSMDSTTGAYDERSVEVPLSMDLFGGVVPEDRNEGETTVQGRFDVMRTDADRAELTDAVVEAIKEDEKESVAKAAERLGISESTLRSWMSRENWRPPSGNFGAALATAYQKATKK